MDLKQLAKLYPNTAMEELVGRFRRSAGSIKTKAREMGLKKSKKYLRLIKSRPRKRHMD